MSVQRHVDDIRSTVVPEFVLANPSGHSIGELHVYSCRCRAWLVVYEQILFHGHVGVVCVSDVYLNPLYSEECVCPYCGVFVMSRVVVNENCCGRQVRECVIFHKQIGCIRVNLHSCTARFVTEHIATNSSVVRITTVQLYRVVVLLEQAVL